MLTDAKLNANRAKAQSSTGPRTPEGKAKVALNSATHGLFSSRDLVLPDEQAEYDQLRADLEAELCPATALERTHAAEILHAAWRLRRCALAEAGLTTDSTLQSGLDPIDRARAHARNNLRRATEDLSRLQTERQLRAELNPESDPETQGLVSRQNIARALAQDARRQLSLRKLKGDEGFDSVLRRAAQQIADEKNSAPITKQTHAPNQPIARNAPCPCRSGDKYKRCCGRQAPGQINNPPGSGPNE